MVGAVARHVVKKGLKKAKDKIKPPTAAQAAKAAKHAERLKKIDQHSRSAKTIGQDIRDGIKSFRGEVAEHGRRSDRRQLGNVGKAAAVGAAGGAASKTKTRGQRKKEGRK